ncbi:Chromatin modification-related protein EAF3 [Kluyveromyces marxianus]
MSIELENKCLCYHGPLLYVAKVLRVYNEQKRTISSKEYTDLSIDDERAEADRPPEDMRGIACYFIHYQGWKASWDEWVGLDRIRPYTEENLELKKSLVEQAKAKAASANASASAGSGSNASAKRVGKKKIGVRRVGRPSKKDKELERRALSENSPGLSETSKSSGTGSGTPGTPGAGLDRKSASPPPNSKSPPQMALLNKRSHPKIYIKIPIALRSVLVDDWENVTKDRQLVQLPSSHPLDEILHQFYTDMAGSLASPVDQAQLSEFINGIKLYFNLSLGKLLLYRLERIQFADLLKKYPNKQPTQVYGTVHLLRLITLLPEMIESSNVDDQTAKIIVKHCDSLLDWIASHVPSTVPVDTYINTSSQYEGVALSM